MTILLCVILICAVINAASDVCRNNSICIVTDYENLKNVVDAPESLDDTTTDLPTTVESRTMAVTDFPSRPVNPPTTTSQPPTVPSYIKTTFSKVCQCDLHYMQCDINCCCDPDCSIVHRQVFTHCEDPSRIPTGQYCFPPNSFFRTHHYYGSTGSNGIFCVVKDNSKDTNEFKPRAPIQNIKSFDNELIRRKMYNVANRKDKKIEFDSDPYKSGHLMWLVERNELIPFRVVSRLYGNLCLGEKRLRYLKNMESTCSIASVSNRTTCNSDLTKHIAFLKLWIVPSPTFLNQSDIATSIKNCISTQTCMSFNLKKCQDHPSTTNCSQPKNLIETIDQLACSNEGVIIDILLLHNGTEGIVKADGNIWFTTSNTITIKFTFKWVDEENPVFVRSGNPGYLAGKPILSGRRVAVASNDSATPEVNVIELSVDPRNWLNVAGHAKGMCSKQDRRNVLFNENVHSSCLLNVDKKFFDKNGCQDLQRDIFSHLFDIEKFNFTSEAWNKYVGIYGDSRVEEIADWIQIDIDFEMLSTNKPLYSFNGIRHSCVNIFNRIYIDIAVAKFGPVVKPQSKIIGVFYRTGPSRSVSIVCALLKNCSDQAAIKLISDVSFFDVSKAPVREFAKPPGLELKLPHDFFYPFFSGKSDRLTNHLSPFYILIFFSYVWSVIEYCHC